MAKSSAAFGQLTDEEAQQEQHAFFRLMGDWLRRDQLRSGLEFKALCRHVCGCDVLAKRLSFIFHVLDLERAEVEAGEAEESAAAAAMQASKRARHSASRARMQQHARELSGQYGACPCGALSVGSGGAGMARWGCGAWVSHRSVVGFVHTVPSAETAAASSNNLDNLDAVSVLSEDSDAAAEELMVTDGVLTGRAAAEEAKRQAATIARPSTYQLLQVRSSGAVGT